MLFIVAIIITSRVIAQRKKAPATLLEVELLDEIVSKEFQIQESKLSFENSIMLGSGASGSVFTAKYFNIDVAVKLVMMQTMGLDNDLSDFYNELKFLNQNAQHMNIIRFFGAYKSEEKNSMGLVMEFCSKGTMSSYIEKHTLPFEQKLQFIKGIASGMQYLHHHDIAHRDLKCENVLLDANLTPKIIDFGFSREIKENANRSLNLTSNIGTAAYCAPEIIQLQVNINPISINTPETANSNQSQQSDSTQKILAYNKRCDVYSFAIIIYVIYFQKKMPYGAIQDNQILYQVATDPTFRPKYDSAAIPENEKWLLTLMEQCWDKNPDSRPSFEQINELLSQKSENDFNKELR